VTPAALTEVFHGLLFPFTSFVTQQSSYHLMLYSLDMYIIRSTTACPNITGKWILRGTHNNWHSRKFYRISLDFFCFMYQELCFSQWFFSDIFYNFHFSDQSSYVSMRSKKVIIKMCCVSPYWDMLLISSLWRKRNMVMVDNRRTSC
jgi:hypothetical protein